MFFFFFYKASIIDIEKGFKDLILSACVHMRAF